MSFTMYLEIVPMTLKVLSTFSLHESQLHSSCKFPTSTLELIQRSLFCLQAGKQHRTLDFVQPQKQMLYHASSCAMPKSGSLDRDGQGGVQFPLCSSILDSIVSFNAFHFRGLAFYGLNSLLNAWKRLSVILCYRMHTSESTQTLAEHEDTC
ncbi:hypothetical protein L7F22_044693 [Adiantum nelumboides]|nr:hypothetical protein [Adiantum nelumboides]